MFVSRRFVLAAATAAALAVPTAGLVSAPALAAEPATFQKNGVAINGYDPVAYFTQRKPVKGNAKFTHQYRGATYHFASARNLALFRAAPAKYAPQYGGYCAFGLGFANKLFPTDPAAFTIYKGKLYLNLNAKVKQRWSAKKDQFITQANTNAKTSHPQVIK